MATAWRTGRGREQDVEESGHGGQGPLKDLDHDASEPARVPASAIRLTSGRPATTVVHER